MQKTNPNAQDGQTVAPSGLSPHLARRYHIELNHRDDRETVIIE